MIVSPITDRTPLASAYARTAAPLRAPVLEQSLRTDVAVVGAGFTGLSTALHLAQQGTSVVIVEANEVGSGGSGRAFGQVVPYAKHHEDHIYTTFGPEYGERLINLLATGPDLVYGLIEKHRMECEAIRTGLLFAAHTPASAKRLEKRARFWKDRAQPVDLLEGEALERVVGSSYYPTALMDHRGGCVNPLAYARGLAKAAVAAGAVLFENTRAVELSRGDKRWRLRTGSGEIIADTVVLATDAYTDELWPKLSASIVPIRAYHILSAPLSENLRKSMLPGGQSLTDSRRLYSGIRVRPDGRLHLSVDGPPFSNSGKAFAGRGLERVRKLFPQAEDLKWEEQVAGWVGVSPDQYPRIHHLASGVYGVVGLSGRGIAFGTLLGTELAKRISGKPESECAMPLSPLRALPPPAITRLLVRGLISLYRILDRVELSSGYLKPAAQHPG